MTFGVWMIWLCWSLTVPMYYVSCVCGVWSLVALRMVATRVVAGVFLLLALALGIISKTAILSYTVIAE